MRAEFRKQFIANLKGIENADLADEIELPIDSIDSLKEVNQVLGIKKLTGYSDYYRVSVSTIIGLALRHQAILLFSFAYITVQ